METNYLSLYTLLYMYSVIGAIVLGTFFLVRIILVKYYSRQLGRELETQVLQISFNSDLKGKDCIVCLN